ncbi:carbonyl reductase [NADPH] 1-like [Limulus polyphemus]|uniref:carbonyl reductase (NADPH) n=1 Tax=Limulus polyphemus TaxID=6850 RepID=A0ABM1S4I7_LIMPO|nr:carbonyl reductase [NADPH] 1-like [Limulus polyphemus]XP_022238542.1 carbonyl reductase [NADPH] 1-like [Limulus polyphemus]
MKKKVAVVTGANKGIGFAIVKSLCTKFKGDIILTARDEIRGKNAVAKLKELHLNPIFYQLDITDADSICRLKEFLLKVYGGLDILVNNAAIAYKISSDTPDADQAEKTIRVNLFGTLCVCKTLFPILRPHARVVNVSSAAGMLHNIPNEKIREILLSPKLTEQKLCDIMKEFLKDSKAGLKQEKGWASTNYEMSKIGVTALTFLQQKQFEKDSREDIVVNTVHPGYVSTDMTNRKGVLNIEQGAEPIVYAALLPINITSPKGEFIWEDSKVVSWR